MPSGEESVGHREGRSWFRVFGQEDFSVFRWFREEGILRVSSGRGGSLPDGPVTRASHTG